MLSFKVLYMLIALFFVHVSADDTRDDSESNLISNFRRKKHSIATSNSGIVARRRRRWASDRPKDFVQLGLYDAQRLMDIIMGACGDVGNYIGCLQECIAEFNHCKDRGCDTHIDYNEERTCAIEKCGDDFMIMENSCDASYCTDISSSTPEPTITSATIIQTMTSATTTGINTLIPNQNWRKDMEEYQERLRSYRNMVHRYNAFIENLKKEIIVLIEEQDNRLQETIFFRSHSSLGHTLLLEVQALQNYPVCAPPVLHASIENALSFGVLN